MWSGAVNRQPGYRARNLQRRGYRAPPPRSKILSGARRYHDRKFSPDFFVFFDTFICIHIKVLKKKKKIKKKCLMTRSTTWLLTYLENFNRPETFKKSRRSDKEHEDLNQSENELWNFLPDWKLHQKFFLNCASCFPASLLAGLLLMWSGAVNRRPGYRARNLQRRGHRAPPPRSKIFSGARRHHDRNFSPDVFVFLIRLYVYI